jgi:hypothetical protein
MLYNTFTVPATARSNATTDLLEVKSGEYGEWGNTAIFLAAKICCINKESAL